MHPPASSRRGFLAAAGTGALGALAGCTGGIGGSGGGDQTETITISNFPLNVPGVVWSYVGRRTDILADKMAEAGYDYELETTFQGQSLFLSEQADIATDLSAINAARAAVERDLDLRIVDRSMSAFVGLIVRNGGEWDPREVGGLEATLEKLAEEQGRIGIFGWGGSDVPTYQIATQRLVDKEFAPEGDFNVVTSEAPAVPQQLVDGELAVGSTGQPYGAGQLLMEGTLAPLMYSADEMAKRGWGLPSLENAVVRADLLETDRAAVEAAVDAWDEGTDWFFERGLEEIPGDEDFMQQLGTDDADVAEYIVRWLLGEDVRWQFETDTQKVYRDVRLTDEWIEANQQFLRNAAEIDQVPAGWEERIDYVKL